MIQPPVRREYAKKSGGGLRDVDAGDRAQFLRAFGWLAAVGLFWGGLMGYLMGGFLGALLGGLGGIAVLGLGGAAVVVQIAQRVGGAAGALYNPSGKSTPYQQGHSYAQSLVARGAYEEAVQAYEEAIAGDPSDPAPYMAIARVLRDELGRFEDAARWLRRARREAEMARGQQILLAKELVELYRGRLADPRRAAPELARLAESFPDTPEGRWALAELRELKEEMMGREDR